MILLKKLYFVSRTSYNESDVNTRDDGSDATNLNNKNNYKQKISNDGETSNIDFSKKIENENYSKTFSTKQNCEFYQVNMKHDKNENLLCSNQKKYSKTNNLNEKVFFKNEKHSVNEQKNSNYYKNDAYKDRSNEIDATAVNIIAATTLHTTKTAFEEKALFNVKSVNTDVGNTFKNFKKYFSIDEHEAYKISGLKQNFSRFSSAEEKIEQCLLPQSFENKKNFHEENKSKEIINKKKSMDVVYVCEQKCKHADNFITHQDASNELTKRPDDINTKKNNDNQTTTKQKIGNKKNDVDKKSLKNDKTKDKKEKFFNKNKNFASIKDKKKSENSSIITLTSGQHHLKTFSHVWTTKTSAKASVLLYACSIRLYTF